MAFRAFAAVPVPPEPPLVRLLEGLAACGADLKVVEPENLHVTLSFLGQVPDEAAPRLSDALRGAARPLAPFAVRLAGVGAFPNARRPRVAWVGMQGAEPLVALALRAREALAAAGHPGDDKDFRAHLTLARTRSTRGLDGLVRFLRDHGRDDLGPLDVREARLYRSTLSPKGPTYETVATAPLEG